MEQQSPADAAAEKTTSALDRTEAENPHLKEILQSFKGLLIEQARWKAELPVQDCTEVAPPDPERFGKGVSLTDRTWLAHLGDLWPTAVERFIPVLTAGFPKIQRELALLQTAILQRAFPPDRFLDAVLEGRSSEAEELAETAGLTPELLGFVLTQASRPMVEKRAESLASLFTGLTWHKGYCPICGSLPGLSLLREKEGQRWLRCGFCATQWRFHRTTCPFCDTQTPDDFEIIFVEGREHERAEVCNRCRKYLPGIDARAFVQEVVPEVAVFGLLHLDAIAQEKGYLPLSEDRWTVS